MKKIRIMLNQGGGTTVTLDSIESEEQNTLYKCHPRILHDEPVRKPVLDTLSR